MKNEAIDKLQQKEQQLKEKEAECRHLEHQIKQLRRHKGLHISDHAIVRYMERTGQLDFEQVKLNLLSEAVLAMHQQFGDGTYPTGVSNMKVVIKNSTILTVLT